MNEYKMVLQIVNEFFLSSGGWLDFWTKLMKTLTWLKHKRWKGYFFHDFVLSCNKPQGWLGIFLDKFWTNKENLTRVGFEPATSGLTCRRSTNWANSPCIGGLFTSQKEFLKFVLLFKVPDSRLSGRASCMIAHVNKQCWLLSVLGWETILENILFAIPWLDWGPNILLDLHGDIKGIKDT